MGLAAGITSFCLVRTGKLKPNKRFGAAPKVLVSSFLAYWGGKFSYVLGEACKDKFLKDAPESETAYHVRKQRGIQQPWTAERDFGSKDTHDDDDDDDIIFRINITIPSLSSFSRGHDAYEDENIVLSDKEKKILEDCENRSYIFYSIPLSILCGGVMLGAQWKGWIPRVRETKSTWILKLREILAGSKNFPFRNRTLHGVLFGLIFGQVLYYMSGDTEDSILEHAPDGEVAKLIRKQNEAVNRPKDWVDERIKERGIKLYKPPQKEIYEDDNSHKEETLTDQHRDKNKSANSFNTPKSNESKENDILKIDPDTHLTYFTDYQDLKSIDWFGKPDIDINEIKESLKQNK